ncbi:hypothetical protein AXE80_13510 [Wenyingzhuangia fucanilytica]|uniref:DUF5723 domain-containing protein n=1 Tax=Wenyingzhuangia fucanilytica TaxID=1790137 RepID=A0A1B1Y910_9FLAO|nr:DUF5723 family protein [Wenyingzhuangia fucanilytica]ANW97246.1 hypothetical protein AXE80_13510 [Wenyingzhuangia fucanilytica]
MVNKIFSYFFLLSSSLFSQSPIGFIDNYSGIQTVLLNPANILDTPYQYDVNILSFNANAGNNYYSLDPFKVLGDLNFGLNDIKPTYSAYKYNRKLESSFGIGNINKYLISKSTSENSNFYGNAVVLGPSFLWTINNYNAVAFSSSIKTYGHAFNLNTKLYNQILDKMFVNKDFDSKDELNEFMNQLAINSTNSSQVFSWAEIGFSYAGIAKQTANDFLKFGFTLKLLRGIRKVAVYSDDLKLDFNYDEDDPENSTLNFTGKATNSYSRLGANFGMGLDFGFVYEKRNKTFPINLRDDNGSVYYSKAPYSYKIGVAITDLGFLKYNNVRTNSENPNLINVNLDSENYTFNIRDYIHITSLKTTSQTYFLPTTARINVDYNILKNYFINSNVDVYMLSNSSRKQIKYISNFVVSPRYESKHFSAFLPVSINRFGIFKAGIGFRTGYFFVGSSSLFTNLTTYSKEGDFFLGIKIPVYNKKVNKQYKNSLDYQLIHPPKLKEKQISN